MGLLLRAKHEELRQWMRRTSQIVFCTSYELSERYTAINKSCDDFDQNMLAKTRISEARAKQHERRIIIDAREVVGD